ncbi:MAG: elongation factor G [Planctomycetota bacterium]
MAGSAQDVRNIALVGHANTGKTALVDALALRTKVVTRRGDSSDGTSISNTEPEEKERKHTLCAHVLGFPLPNAHLNLIDTPGHPDFMAEAVGCMQVVETAIVCISATSGVTFHDRRLWAEGKKAGLARAIVVTHLDAENTDFDELLIQMNEVFGDKVVPITYPDQSGPGFSAVHDVLKGEGPNAATHREALEERVAEADDEMLEAYLESGTISDEQLESHFTSAIVQNKLVPLFVVGPKSDIGLDQLIHGIESLLPSPAGYGPRNAAEPDSDSYGQLVETTEDGPFAGKVFRVIVDPYVGRISYLRCFRGSLSAEEGFLNVRTGKHEKVGGLLGMKGGEKEPLQKVSAGDLFAVAKLETLGLGDTVTADATPLKFPRATFPPPPFSLAVTPKTRGDEQKINEGLEKLAAEDPTFFVERHPVTSELIVSGQSPLHLEVQLARLLRRYGVSTENHKPTIPYRETVIGRSDGHHRHKKQSGGRGQFAEVFLRVAPRESESGFEFIDSVVGGSIPRQFIPEVEKGVRKFMEKGGLAGCPVVDCSAELYDGKFHDVDSDQISFQLAGERAFLDGFLKSKPVLLEPIMDVEIQVPERFTGDVAGSLSTLRGRMAGMEIEEGIQTIRATVPLKEMQDYATQLRSMTAGEGSFTMQPAGYEQLPSNLQQEIVAAFKKAQESH